MQNATKAKGDLSGWSWLWAPLLLVFACSVLRVLLGETYYTKLVSGESGIVENLTAAMLVVAIAAGVLILRSAALLPDKRLKWWVLLLAIGCFYFAGEEVSWGQHHVGWATPDGWANVNKQQETNLHNTHGLLDKAPRTALTLAALFGGILVPVLVRFRKVAPDRGRANYWLWPTYVCIPACILALTVTIPHKLAKSSGAALPTALDVEAGELKEFFLAMFLTLYLCSFYTRLKQQRERVFDEERPSMHPLAGQPDAAGDGEPREMRRVA